MFDVCLMNPPYGAVGGDTLHLKFVDKCLDISKEQVSIFPYNLLYKDVKSNNKFKEKFDNYLIEVEEVDSKEFQGTRMPNVGIYIFSNNKQQENIKIKTINTGEKTIKSLLEVSKFDDYEKDIIKYLESQGQQKMIHAGRMDRRYKEIAGMNDKEIENHLNNKILKNSVALKEYWSNNPYNVALVVNQSLPKLGKAITSNSGQIFDNYNDIEQFFLKEKKSSGYNIICLDSKKAAENCKDAIQRPVLRFTIYRTQEDQNMYINKVYKYIPNIDWSNPKVKTDEGLLELCGCPKDKAKEYAEYCKKVIEEVDKK